MSIVFCLIAMLLAAKSDVLPVPRGVHKIEIDETWSCTFNTSLVDVDNIPAVHASIVFNGWPAGIIGPVGGCIAAGEAANEQTLTEALKAACIAAGVDKSELLKALGERGGDL